jgi:hypothetical protein
MSGFVKDALLHRYFSQVGTGFRVKFETPWLHPHQWRVLCHGPIGSGDFLQFKVWIWHVHISIVTGSPMCCRYWARGYDNLLQSKKAQLFISKVGCTSSGKICTSCVFSLDVKVSCSNNRVCLSKNFFFFCMQHLDGVQSRNVMHYMQAIHQ